MSFRVRAVWSLWLCVALLCVACGDLAVELDEGDKDRLAEFVEGEADDAGDVSEPGPDLGEVNNLPQENPDLGDVDTEGIARLEHLGWDLTVRRYVRQGRFDYVALGNSAESVELLDRYLALVAALDPGQLASSQERLAFWLNAYNALVVRRALTRLSRDPDFSPQDDDFAFFKAQIHRAGGGTYSLDHIEHGIIRGQEDHPSLEGLDAVTLATMARHHAELFGDGPIDARIHVGLNCGAVSCPPLPDVAFTGDEVDAQLNARAIAFVADPARGAGPEGISSLFMWFAQDFSLPPFGGSRGFVEAHRDDVSDVDFERFLFYDWTLNAAR